MFPSKPCSNIPSIVKTSWLSLTVNCFFVYLLKYFACTWIITFISLYCNYLLSYLPSPLEDAPIGWLNKTVMEWIPELEIRSKMQKVWIRKLIHSDSVQPNGSCGSDSDGCLGSQAEWGRTLTLRNFFGRWNFSWNWASWGWLWSHYIQLGTCFPRPPGAQRKPWASLSHRPYPQVHSASPGLGEFLGMCVFHEFALVYQTHNLPTI